MPVTLDLATPDDAEAVAALRTAVAAHLTQVHGRGHWSSAVSAKGVLNRMRTGKVFLVRQRTDAIATLCLSTQKPWAIDPSYFSAASQPLYLVDMAVSPEFQRQGIGRRCLADAERLARSWPADAIRLDAYDSPAGAGAFYQKCGYREVGRTSYRQVPLIYYESVLAARGEE
jgi:GNAT superfamily N-acetyltransferase